MPKLIERFTKKIAEIRERLRNPEQPTFLSSFPLELLKTTRLELLELRKKGIPIRQSISLILGTPNLITLTNIITRLPFSELRQLKEKLREYPHLQKNIDTIINFATTLHELVLKLPDTQIHNKLHMHFKEFREGRIIFQISATVLDNESNRAHTINPGYISLIPDIKNNSLRFVTEESHEIATEMIRQFVDRHIYDWEQLVYDKIRRVLFETNPNITVYRAKTKVINSDKLKIDVDAIRDLTPQKIPNTEINITQTLIERFSFAQTGETTRANKSTLTNILINGHFLWRYEPHILELLKLLIPSLPPNARRNALIALKYASLLDIPEELISIKGKDNTNPIMCNVRISNKPYHEGNMMLDVSLPIEDSSNTEQRNIGKFGITFIPNGIVIIAIQGNKENPHSKTTRWQNAGIEYLARIAKQKGLNLYLINGSEQKSANTSTTNAQKMYDLLASKYFEPSKAIKIPVYNGSYNYSSENRDPEHVSQVKIHPIKEKYLK